MLTFCPALLDGGEAFQSLPASCTFLLANEPIHHSDEPRKIYEGSKPAQHCPEGADKMPADFEATAGSHNFRMPAHYS